jgi:hypothetical protein
MKIRIFYNMERTRLGRWFMEGYPAKYHYPFMFFTGPKGYVPEALYRHELQHHYQVLRDGYLKFNWRYITQLRTVGYRNIDYEIEAYAMQREKMTDAEWEMVGTPGLDQGLDDWVWYR